MELMDLVKQLLEQQQQHLAYYFQHIDPLALGRAVELCANTKGLIVLTGVGKSGIVAEKIAMTLISTGTRALYVPPTNFLHGDIGILSSEDMLMLISRSGETEELLDIIPFAKKKRATLFALVSRSDSRLAQACHASLCLPVERELCPFDLAPTTSTTVQLLFGDLLTVALMRLNKFSLAEYALNHPAGALGKKMTVTVEELMFQGKKIPFSHPDQAIIDGLVELSNKHCGALLVAEENRKLLGLFTDGDLRRVLQEHGPAALQQPIRSFMIHSPRTISRQELASSALRQMQTDPSKYISVLPVVENGIVVGILRLHDIIQSGVV